MNPTSRNQIAAGVLMSAGLLSALALSEVGIRPPAATPDVSAPPRGVRVVRVPTHVVLPHVEAPAAAEPRCRPRGSCRRFWRWWIR